MRFHLWFFLALSLSLSQQALLLIDVQLLRTLN